MQKICVVVPCYNESKRLQVPLFVEFLTSNSEEVDFLFVNDGSKDNTLEVLSEIKNLFTNNIKILDQQPNQGKAEAVRKGMLQAVNEGYEIVGFFDADLSTPLNEILRLKNHLNQHYKIVIGSRVKRLGAEIHRSAKRHFFGRVFSTFSSTILDLPVYDSQCGAKFFHKDVIVELFDQPFLTKWIFDVELLARYKKNVGKEKLLNQVLELPINSWKEIGGSKLKLSDFFKVPYELYLINKFLHD
jgi:dolichyl-phosphate beta-glucosyltransferase